MRCVKLTMAYDGTAYSGWQVQPHAVTIQARLEEAIEQVTGETSRVLASGRTDAGVHAAGQVVAWRTQSKLPPPTLVRALNANLPDDIRVLRAEEAETSFHPIRDALRKRYRYSINNAPVADVFRRQTSWFVPEPLDIAAMLAAGRRMLGRQDCRAFETSGSPRESTVREILAVDIEAEPIPLGQLIKIEIEADGFLYNMMRNIVGTLVVVGRGKQPAAWVSGVIASRDRRQAGPTAPARGLCLLEVTYPSS